MIFFLLGLIFGSFFNNLIYRLEKGENFLFGKSKCPSCSHKLSFLDLIPVISFLFLKGKCRYCKKKISLFYPIGEILTGLLFLSLYFRFKYLFFDLKIQPLLTFLYYFLFLIVLYLLALYDFRTKTVPIIFLIFGFLIWLIFFILSFFYPFSKVSFLETLNSFFDFSIKSLDFSIDLIFNLFISLLFFFLSYLGLVGTGDFFVVLFIGLFLKAPELLFVIFLAGFLGSLYSLPFIFKKKYNLKSEIPFVPFLFLSTWFIICFGNEISKIFFKI